MEARIKKIIPFSSVDGPGNRTAIFLQGCNINCLYCHNPETRDAIGEDTTMMSTQEVMEVVQKQMPFIRGITVSGGECMLHPDYLTELFTKAKAQGLSTLIDSNGTIPFEGKDELLAVTDGVMLDVKAFDSEDHRKVTGAGNDTVLANAVFLAQHGKLEEIRCVICPKLYNGEKSVAALGEYMKPFYKPGDFHFKLITYRPMGVREEYINMPSPSRAYMDRLENILAQMGYEDTVIV